MKFEDSGHHLSDKFEARIRSVAISAQALVLFAAMTTSPALQARRIQGVCAQIVPDQEGAKGGRQSRQSP